MFKASKLLIGFLTALIALPCFAQMLDGPTMIPRAGIQFKDNGSNLVHSGYFNVTGTGYTLTNLGGVATLNLTGGGLSTNLTSAHIFVGNGSNVATDVAVSGDISLLNTGAVTVNKASSAFAFTGIISPPSFSTTQDNYNPTGGSTASTYRLDPTADTNFTGIAGGTAGRAILLQNVSFLGGGFTLHFFSENTGSSPGNRLLKEFYLPPLSQALIVYDPVLSRWAVQQSGIIGITSTDDSLFTNGISIRDLGINTSHTNNWVVRQEFGEIYALGTTLTLDPDQIIYTLGDCDRHGHSTCISLNDAPGELVLNSLGHIKAGDFRPDASGLNWLLDIQNDIFAAGDSSGNYFNLDMTNRLYYLGDYDGHYFGTNVSVNDSTLLIKMNAGSLIGANLDFTSRFYEFGEQLIGLDAAAANIHLNGTARLVTGTTSLPPLKFDVTGDILTTPIAGVFEPKADNLFYTISTGTARKIITLSEAVLTSGKLPVAATNGRLTDSAGTGYVKASSGTISYQAAPIPVADGGTGQTTLNAAGIPQVVASNDLTGQTTAVSSITSTTVPNDGSSHQYNIGGYITITAVTASTVTLAVDYTDETSTSRTATFFGEGLTTAAISSTGISGFPDLRIRAKQNTSITVKTTITGIAITYDVGASIMRIN